MTILRFVPRDRPDLPVLSVFEAGSEFAFTACDAKGDEAVRTYHADLPDALRQVASSIITYGGVYDVVAPTEKQKALNEAAAYLRRCSARMREQQRKDYNGERGRNIPRLLQWANEVEKL